MPSALHLFLLFFVSFLSVYGENAVCNRHMCGDKVKFWLATTRNSNNQWMTETGLEHPKKPGSNGWKLQVENESTNCDGENYCRLVASLSALCPDVAFKSFGIGHYKLFLNESTWDEAKRICEEHNSHLAVVDSAIEVAALKEVVQPSKTTYVFIGFNDREKEGTYIDIFGRPVKSFWSKGQPDDFKKAEDCGTITKEGLLNDYPCTAKINFICERSNDGI